MKKLFRALSLCLTLALCVSGSTAALAESPAATPAPQDERVITDVSPLEDQIRNIVGFTTSTGGPYDFEQADHKSAVQAYGAEPAEGAVALLRIYARAEDRGDASINFSGHSFLSVRNVSDHDIEVGGLRIAPDTEMTFSPAATAGSTPVSGIIWRATTSAIWPIPTTRTSMLSRPR